jgi:predicted nucleic acid-binding protein
LIALPDINVLLALAWSNHPHHEAAHRWFACDSAAGWATERKSGITHAIIITFHVGCSG